ncbi:MAG: hypothetical protein GTO18_00790 [Anaerolineales bacterium]|nr:hypothetical protein [Anaerolineales bacterium]
MQSNKNGRINVQLSPIHVIILVLGITVLAGCKADTPTPTPAPALPTETPTPIWEPSITSTPSIPDSGLPVVDDGSALPVYVVDQQPAIGQELPVTGEVVVRFNQPMNTSQTASAWYVYGPEGDAVQGQITWSDEQTLRFKPSQDLIVGSTYQVILHESAASVDGGTVLETLLWHFNTVGELQVSQTFPENGTFDVASDSVITAIFNRPVVPLVIAEERDTLPNPLEINPPVEGQGEWVNTSVFAFRPKEPLRGGTTYSVTVEAGLTDVLQETQLGEDYVWYFTTITPSIQSFRLASGVYNPASGHKNVLLDEAFIIEFFQPMDVASTEAALSLIPADGLPISIATEWNEENTLVTVTSEDFLELETNYIFRLDTSAKAVDGNNLDEGLNWSFTTVPSPSVLYISPPEGQSRGFYSELTIQFASPMNIESVKSKLVITPEPEEEISWWYDDYLWRMNAYFLQPSTRYVIRALPGMLDIYGNATTEEYVVEFTTPAAPPQAGLQMPFSMSIMREGGPQDFFVMYRNVTRIDFELYQLTASEFVAFMTGDLYRYDYEPPADTLVWETTKFSTGELNERVYEAYQPRTSSGDPIPSGYYFLTMDTPDISHPREPFLDQRLMIVANTNLTFKTTTNETLIWATDLETGNPLSGVSLSILDENFWVIGEGETDSDGLLKLDLPTPIDPYEERFVLTDEDQFFGFASSSWGSGVNQYDYGIWSSYYAPANRPKVYVYTDRPIYRPDQPVYFKGIIRLDDDLSYSRPPIEVVQVIINNYKETIYDEILPLSSYGSFDGEITLDPDAVLGYYSIDVMLPADEEYIGGVGFTVAEYRKPEFQVQVSASPTDVLAGDEYDVTITADYYSGGGVSEAMVEWTLKSSPFRFSPADKYSRYSFTDHDADRGYYPDYEGVGTELMAEGEGTTNALGELVVTLIADLSEYTGSRQFLFEATVTDLSKNAVSGRTTITAHRGEYYPGVKPSRYVGTAGRESSFDLVVLDWDSEPISGQLMEVEIVERRWHSVQEQDATGRVKWKSSVEEIPVTTIETTTGNDGEATVSFVPDTGGVYKAKVTVLDPHGNVSQSSAFMWVAGPGYIPWRQTDDRSFDLISDSTSYSPGDTAEILIASPFQGESYALITIERGHIYQYEVLRLTNNSTLYKLPITANLAPNFYVSVMIVKGIDETNPRPNFKMGVIELEVDTREQEVFVTVVPDRAEAGPGEKVAYTVSTLDVKGNPVQAELSLGLSDLATLSLIGPNSDPILDFFYNRRTLGVWTSMPITLSLEDYNATIIESQEPEGPGMGSGGGKGEGAFGVAEVRQDFPDTAFWDAHITTGTNGTAVVTVTLPDNLTTWRMDARAVTADTMVGSVEHDLISTRPLLVRPQTPRFFVQGDQARLGAAVHNNTNAPLSVQVDLYVQGVQILSDETHELGIEANSQAYVSWDVRVEEEVSRVDLVFNAEGVTEDGELLQDASRPPLGTLEGQGLPVLSYEAFETVGTSGQMTSGGTILEAVSLPSTMTVTEGSLSIQVAPSLAAGMTDGLTFLEHFPHECVEQTVSRFLPNVLSTRALKTAGLSDPALEANLETQVNTALQRLLNWQNPDGGWGWWPGVNQQSDVLTTAYVVLGLVEAEEARYTISQGVLDRGVGFLSNQVEYAYGFEAPSMLNREAFVLYVLARAGEPNISATVMLYDERQNMAIYARAFLARTLHIIDPSDPRIQTLLSDFATYAITSATGTHWEEEVTDYANWNTDTRTTAIVLSTLSLLDSNNPLNGNAVRWLMSHRTEGHWRGTQETAWSLMALTNWMEASGELDANYQYAVALNGERLGGGIANQATLRRTHHLHVDVVDLLTDQANRLAFARDDGPGNLYYTTHMDLALPVDQVAALDQGIIVSRSYYHIEDTETDLSEIEPITQAQVGDLLLVRLTLVAPNALHYVMVNDPLPAGLEAVDPSLEISPQSQQIPWKYSWDDIFTRGWGWWRFQHIQLRDEEVVLSADYLPAGTYIYTYMVRAGTAGTFNVVPPTAQEFYFPEVYGRGEGSTFEVKP